MFATGCGSTVEQSSESVSYSLRPKAAGQRSLAESRSRDDIKSRRGTYAPKRSNSDLLTAREERKLLTLYLRDGDARARTELVERNIRLVRSIAWQRICQRSENTRRRISLEDLVQDGIVGLIEALDRFDLTRYTRLSTYATPHIRSRIDSAIDNMGYPVRLTEHVRRQITKYVSIRRSYRKDNGNDPSTQQLIDLMNPREDTELGHNSVRRSPDAESARIRDIEAAMRVSTDAFPLYSLSLDITEEASRVNGAESPASGRPPLARLRSSELAPASAYEEALTALDDQTLLMALGQLPPLERAIVTGRYGLFGHSQKSMSAMAREHSYCVARISQVCKRAEARLLRFLETESGGMEHVRQLYGMGA